MYHTNNTLNMTTMYKITNGCGGKKGTKCYVEHYILPFGKPQTQVPEQVSDDSPKPKGK